MQFKKIAWEQLKNGRYGKVLLVFFLVNLILGAIGGTVVASVVTFVLAGPVAIGTTIYLQQIVENGADGNNYPVIWEQGFKRFGDNIVLYLLKMLYIFLWSLLLIVPGIIKAFSYSMAEWILAKHPEMTPSQAIQRSQELMQGHKSELFVLGLSFIGWFLLCILTLGIGFVFLIPYVELTFANFKKKIYDEAYSFEIIDDEKETLTK